MQGRTSMENQKSISKKKTKQQLFKLLQDKTLSLDFVSALAGDRDLTIEEERIFKLLKEDRGKEIFSDLLFAITHQYYSTDIAEELWTGIIKHKYEMSHTLDRNIRISVASLDYLANLKTQLDAPIVISEPNITTIVEEALRDGLTQLFNHSTFYAKLEGEIKRYERYNHNVSLIMIDIDNFKKFNDLFGHQEGDRVLVLVATEIKTITRNIDICARYGGEEFAVILPNTGIQEAAIIAERLRCNIEKIFSPTEKVTISLGIATCPEDATLIEDLINKTDKALYQSKANGKNRVTIFQNIYN